MFYAVLLVAPTFSQVAFNLDGMVEAQARVKRERILASVETFTQSGTLRSTQIIDVDRGREAKITFQPDTLKPFVEIFHYKIEGNSSVAYAYRPGSGQFTESKGAEKSLPALVKAATPIVDDFVIGLLIPEGMAALRNRIDANQPGWKTTIKNGKISMKLSDDKSGSEIVLNQSTLRPLAMSFGSAAGAIAWEFKYQAAQPLKTPRQSPNAYLVSRFDELLGPAQTESAGAKAGLARLYSRYEEPSSIGYTVSTDGEKTTVYYTRTTAYQSDNRAEWLYDGDTLSILNKSNNRFYSGKATRTELIEAVAATGSRIETSLRSLIQGRNPFRLMLNNFTEVASKGSTNSPEPSEILLADSPFADLKLTVAKKDGFVLRIDSTPKTRDGQKLPSSVSTYTRVTGGKTKVSPPASTIQRPLSELTE